MTREVSLSTRIMYCLVLLGAVLPIGIAATGWVGLAKPGSIALVPFIGPILFLLLGLYRVFVVMRNASSLDSPEANGIASYMRPIGVLLLYVGAIFTVLGWIARPLMHASVQSHTGSGIEFFMVGVYFALLGPIGTIGLVLFELSRLRGFEQHIAGEV